MTSEKRPQALAWDRFPIRRPTQEQDDGGPFDGRL
jgi:hypothetical protein